MSGGVKISKIQAAYEWGSEKHTSKLVDVYFSQLSIGKGRIPGIPKEL
jgi:hypothetical protein